jgi:hypothetical protein
MRPGQREPENITAEDLTHGNSGYRDKEKTDQSF